jgi:hypothetical protein
VQMAGRSVRLKHSIPRGEHSCTSRMSLFKACTKPTCCYDQSCWSPADEHAHASWPCKSIVQQETNTAHWIGMYTWLVMPVTTTRRAGLSHLRASDMHTSDRAEEIDT